MLIIDADLRKPQLHNVFQLANEDGLTTILSQTFSEHDPFRFIVHHESGIGLLPSGPIMGDSAELLGLDKMSKIIAEMEGVYDYVIVDSPPISHFTDAVLLSNLVDQVMLVVDTNKSMRAAVRRSCQLLQDAGAKRFSVVLNKLKETKGPRYQADYAAYRLDSIA